MTPSLMTKGEELVTIQDLTVRFGSVTALDGVCLALRPGPIGLLGPNGAGKTTTLRTIAGFIMAQKGTVTVDGKNYTRVPPNNRCWRTVTRNPSR